MIACNNPIFARSSGLSQEANGSVVNLLNMFACNYFWCSCVLFTLFFIQIINPWSTLMFSTQTLNLELQENHRRKLNAQIFIYVGKIIITCNCI